MEEYINKRATLNEKVALYRLKCVKSLISFSIRFLFKGFKNFVFRIISNEAQENLSGKENVLFIQLVSHKLEMKSYLTMALVKYKIFL